MTEEIDWNAGWVRLSLWQRFRLWLARYRADDIVVYATDFTPVKVSADFAELNWKAPGLYQDLIDDQATRIGKYT